MSDGKKKYNNNTNYYKSNGKTHGTYGGYGYQQGSGYQQGPGSQQGPGYQPYSTQGNQGFTRNPNYTSSTHGYNGYSGYGTNSGYNQNPHHSQGSNSSANTDDDRTWLRVTSKQRERKGPTITPTIQVQTIYPGYKHWVRFYRGNIYKNSENGDDIYHWHLESHNFFDIDENRRTSKENRVYLAFTDPDYEIIIMDKAPKYAFDKKSEVSIRPVLNYARWRQIKFKPNSFIAKNAEQIEEALKHIKYCMVENLPVPDDNLITDDPKKPQDDKPSDLKKSKEISITPSTSTPNAGIVQLARTPFMSSIFTSGRYSATTGTTGTTGTATTATNATTGSATTVNSAQTSTTSESRYNYGDRDDNDKDDNDKNLDIEKDKDREEDEAENRTLHIVYPDRPPHQNLLEEIVAEKQQKQKLDIMSSSPLGCLESPNF